MFKILYYIYRENKQGPQKNDFMWLNFGTSITCFSSALTLLAKTPHLMELLLCHGWIIQQEVEGAPPVKYLLEINAPTQKRNHQIYIGF